MKNRRKTVSVIGPNQARCNVNVYNFGLQLGEALATAGYTIVCGGVYGFMEAVCKGAHSAGNYTYGTTVGILSGSDKEEANEYVDVVIPTGLGWARNQLIVNAADIVIAVAGGAGTLSEVAYAWQVDKPVICYTEFEGWAQKLAVVQMDAHKKTAMFRPASTLEEVMKIIKYGV